MNFDREDNTSETGAPRDRGGARRVVQTTSRWLVGRVVKLAREAGCGFVRGPSGAMIYFALADVVGGEPAVHGLRPGLRVRFKPAGRGVPRAVAVAML